MILRRKKIEIILTNMDKELRLSGIAARFTDVKAVICRKGIDSPLKNKLCYRFTYNRLATAVIANSEATKNTILRNVPWLYQNNVNVIYNGIDPGLFSYENTHDIRSELGISENSPLIGFVGRLNIQKGITYLLQAFEQVVN
jgi:glycosyltransferase involved in cell wall biosynthesis